MTSFSLPDDFLGDGRVKVQPRFVLPGTRPIPVTRGQARQSIARFIQHGSSTHSLAGSTLWVILTYCQESKTSYRMTAVPGEGYYVEKMK